MDARSHEWAGFFSLLADQAQAASWRAALPAMTPILHQGSSPITFHTPEPIEQLARWLVAHDYDAEPGRSHTEYCRLIKPGVVITLFYTGTVLVQGADNADALAELAALVRPSLAALPRPELDEGGR